MKWVLVIVYLAQSGATGGPPPVAYTDEFSCDFAKELVLKTSKKIDAFDDGDPIIERYGFCLKIGKEGKLL